MPNWLLIIFVIGSCVTFGSFLRKFLKCCFRLSCLAAFSLAFAVLFLLLTLFTVCHAILDCLSSNESLILLIWFCMYSVCSFRYMLVNSFRAFWSFWALILVQFLPLHLEGVFKSARYFITANVSHRTLDFTLCLVDMHSAAVDIDEVIIFVIRSVFDISWSSSNLLLSVNVYFSLISLWLSKGQS